MDPRSLKSSGTFLAAVGDVTVHRFHFREIRKVKVSVTKEMHFGLSIFSGRDDPDGTATRVDDDFPEVVGDGDEPGEETWELANGDPIWKSERPEGEQVEITAVNAAASDRKYVITVYGD